MRLVTLDSVQKLQMALRAKAKESPGFRFYSLYDKIYRKDVLWTAWRRCLINDGAPGVDGQTFTEIEEYGAMKWLAELTEELRTKSYRPQAVRRVYLPKPDGKQRPLGIPTIKDRVVETAALLVLEPIFDVDLQPEQHAYREGHSPQAAVQAVHKLLQEVLRSLLDAYYDPQFSPHSHGFRPGRGCHTALGDITRHWRGVKWFVEGDIAQCFDRLEHSVMLSILSERIHDNRFLRLITSLLDAGYLEDWKYHRTLSGSPQGGVVSPILSNIYLDKLDQFVETVLIPTYHRGGRRKPYPPYMALLNQARRKRDAGDRDEARRLRQQAQRLPSRDPNDPNFRRLWYVRYADDFLLGFSGPREEAGQIKLQLEKFLHDELRLELSRDKTLITRARTEAARFLGYEIVTLNADDKHDHRSHRCINGAPGLKVPVDVIRSKCSQYMRRGKPIQRAERINDSDFSIVSQYQAEYRGLVNYYLMAFNVHRLWQLHWVMKLSLLKTLADKFRTSVSRIRRKYQKTVELPHGTQKVLEVVIDRGPKKPLVTRFGGIELRWQKDALLNDTPKEVFSGRSELVQRLLADECELCGVVGNCQVHHIRKLADLRRPGQGEKSPWVKRMATRRRKTLVVCESCHAVIHQRR